MSLSNCTRVPTVLLAGLLCLIQSGCDEAGLQDRGPESAPATVMEPVQVAIPLAEQKKGPTVAELQAMTPAERKAHIKPRREMSAAIRSAVASSESWEEIDAVVRAEMERHPEVPNYVTEQTAAVLMLDHHLLDAPSSVARQEAIAFYTAHLLGNESTNAHLINRSLDALAGSWSEARIAAAAETALTNVQRHLQRMMDCADCSVEQLLDRSANREGERRDDLGAIRSLLDKTSP